MLFHSIFASLIILLVSSVIAPLSLTAQPDPLTPEAPDNRIMALHPILPCIFFDAASAVIPARYHRFTSPDETAPFADTANSGGILATYYDVLNIIGYRMRKYPATRVELGISRTRHWRPEETQEIFSVRQQAVYRYLIDIWRIDSNRITVLHPTIIGTRGVLPSREMVEAEERHVWILSDDWELLRPIETSSIAEQESSLRIFPLILYKFDSPEPGELNKRILQDIIVPAITPATMIVQVTGYTDIVGLEDRNRKLAELRARATADIIRKVARRRKVSVVHKGVGEEWETYGSELPEQRFFSRRVEVMVVNSTVPSDE